MKFKNQVCRKEVPYMNITGSRLAMLRKENNMTQKELAKILSMAPSTISSYENGRNYVDITKLNKLADFFEVSADYLIGRTDERRPTDFYQHSRYNDYYIREITDTMLTLDETGRNDVLQYAKFISQQQKDKE